MTEPNKPPRRAVVMKAEIDAHTRRDLANHLRNLAIQIERGECGALSISGGCSSGHIVTLHIDEEQTPERWLAQQDAWIANERMAP